MTVWGRVRKKMLSISLSTVHATLRELESLGLVRHVADVPLRVDPDTSAHPRLVCERCGRVVDLPDAGAIAAARGSAERLGHTVKKVDVSIGGTCGRCGHQRRRRIPQ